MKTFRDYFLNEAVTKTKTIEADEIKILMKKFKYSKANTSVWRRNGYTNLAVALSDDLYLYYLPNLNKIKLEYSASVYSVSYKDEYFYFFDNVTVGDGDKQATYSASKSQFFKDSIKFFNELQEEFISGKSFKDGKETNAMEIATKYKDLSW